jgi:arylsulfatase A
MKHVLLILASLLLAPPAALHAADAAKPNIVIILSDDYGYGSAGCYGANPTLVTTPNIDRIAKEGRRFTDANTTSSVCSPTRYSVLTGRYCWRTSLKSEVLSTFAPLHIETTRLNMASLLKKHGYATASVGKWHLGYGTADDSPKWRTDYTAELSPGPLDIGFDYHFSVPSNHGDVAGVFVENRFVYGLRSGKIPAGMKVAGPVPDDDDFKPTYTAEDMENPKGGVKILDLDAPRRKNERVMKVLTDKASAWIQQQPKDKPFFLYFTPVAVHAPITPDKDIAGQSKGGLYCDWIHELDRSVGRILDTLDKMGVADNTLVVFSSDNGGVKELAREDLWSTKAWHAGLVRWRACATCGTSTASLPSSPSFGPAPPTVQRRRNLPGGHRGLKRWTTPMPALSRLCVPHSVSSPTRNTSSKSAMPSPDFRRAAPTCFAGRW